MAKMVKPHIFIAGKEFKECNKCKRYVPIEKYYKNCDAKDGIATTCKECGNKTVRNYAKTHRESINKQSRERYSNNPISRLESNKKSRLKNIVNVRISKHDYYLKNMVKEKERSKLWAKTPMGKASRKVQWQKRYSREKGVVSTLTTQQWKECLEYFQNKCAYCGEEVNLHQDHFVPLSAGGEFSKQNVIPACQRCNFSKNKRIPSVWYPKQPFYSKEREQKILKYLNYNPKTNIQQLALTI